MREIPRDGALDSTLALLREGYEFVSNRCNRYETDVFQARIMLRRTVCMRGVEAAKLFYDEQRMTRRGAAPLRLQLTLFGRGGVQSLDGQAHRHRKAMFMSLMSSESIAAYAAKHPLGFGTCEDIAQAAVFLLSDASKWVTGSIMAVDGGMGAA